MTGKPFVEFSDSFSWDRWLSGRQPHVTRPLNFGQKRRHRLALGLRLGLYALTFFLGGALLFIFIGLCAVVVLADDHCGPRFGYYGCEIPEEAGSLNDSRAPGMPSQTAEKAGLDLVR